jgi:HlyD family secretion protein
MLKYGLPSAALVLLVLAMISIARTQPVRKEVQPPAVPATAAYSNQVAAVGLVESASENIAISLPVSGLITRVDVRAGDHVRKGQPLFSLDDRDLRAELALRQSSLEVARARMERLADAPRPEEIPPAEARVREAAENANDAETQLRLIESVQDRRAIREEDLLRRRIAAGAAKARLEQAQADLKLLKAGTWAPDLAVAKTQVDEAQHQVERVQADLARMVVTAPIDGEILQCKVRLGEYAQSGPLPQPLILMGDTSHLNVRVDVDEQDAARVNPQEPATASLRGNGANRFPLHFVRFEPYVIPKKNLTNDTSERVDTRVLEAVFSLDPGTHVWPGQQMDVYIKAAAQ